MIATMEADPISQRGTCNQDDSVATLRRVDATGFIRLNVLRPAREIAAKVHGKKK
jgi:hypothetical protein